MIGEQTNYDNSFFRMIGVALVKTMSRGMGWVNHYEDKKQRVLVPFYMSLSGSERLLLDAFSDDIVGNRVELNTDEIPRGVITFNGFTTNTSKLANPNQYINKQTVINGKVRSFIKKTKGIPIEANYDIDITLISENDVLKASEKLIQMLYNYMYFNIDYFGIKIDASFNLPDDKTIEITREQTLDSDVKKHIKFSIVVNTYYPCSPIDIDDYIICDNDDEIDWTRTVKKRPPLDDEDSDIIKRVNWKYYIWDSEYVDQEKPDGKDRMNNTPTENF